MPYTLPCTSDHPAFIIYLLDLSASMNEDCGGRRRIDVVANALEQTRRSMIKRSRRGDKVRPRYAVAMIGYSNTVVDLLGGVKTIDQLEKLDLPALHPQGATNTGAAFQAAYTVLQKYLPGLQDCPAPLICHMTDGGANQGEPAGPVADKIKQLGTADGTTLVENIYIGTQLLHQPITEVQAWTGVHDAGEIREEYVQNLWHMASPLPESYAVMMNESAGYRMRTGAKMLIPAETPDMISLAFAMSAATPMA